MALPLENTFEGGTDTTTITTANSGGASGNAFDAVSLGANSTVEFEAAEAGHETMGAEFRQNAATAGNAQLEWRTASVGSALEIWGRVYFKLPTLPTTNAIRLVNVYDTDNATRVAVFNLTTLPRLRVANGTPASNTTGSITLSTSTLYRAEFYAKAGTAGVAVATMRVYAGESETLIEEVTRQTDAGGTNCGAIRFGHEALGLTNGTDPYIYYLDSIEVNATGYPGPIDLGGAPTETRLPGRRIAGWY